MPPLSCIFCVKSLQLCPTLCDLWTVAHHAPLSVGFFRQEYWSGLLCPPPEDLPDPGIEPTSPVSPVLLADSLPAEPSGKPQSYPFIKLWNLNVPYSV